MRAYIAALLCVAFNAAAQPSVVPAQPSADVVAQIGFDQKVGGWMPLELTFTNSQSEPVRLGNLLRNRPVIVTLVYFQCPQLCSEVLNGLTRSLRAVALEPGKDFNLITLSIDPRDSPALGALKKANYVRLYGKTEANGAWHWLVGSPNHIQTIADALGFRYRYDAATGQFAHAAGIMILTPRGQIARYFFGIDFSPRDLRLSLIEAGADRISKPIDRLLLLCYRYDPAFGRYGFWILGILRLAGLFTLAALTIGVVFLARRGLRRNRPWPDP